MSGKGRKQKDINKKNSRHRVRKRILEVLELPREAILDVSKLTMIDGGNLVIENYKNVLEYQSNSIRVNTGRGVIRIKGKVLMIREITYENILIEGEICSIEFNR